MVKRAIQMPHMSIETRMSRPSSPVTPNSPTSGWMKRKYIASSATMPPR